MNVRGGTAPVETTFEVKLYHRRTEIAQDGSRPQRRCNELNSRILRARDLEEARLLAKASFPADQGFVISSVAAVTLQ